ncbi:DUF2157 domain-containing protein [Paenibacillus solisilvae]|uniref:DUF2157 domain-containing protein n=1 Tax=Paenibacillus solisilvae TaxID=2486751 RepID=A0ABW0W6K7_9BACL
MSRKWLEHEGRSWTEKGIITSEQYKRILDLYPVQKRAAGLIPILGSILVGLGILSFIAANWQDIPQLVRLIMICVIMAGFYAAGDRFLKKDHEKLGAALMGLGLASFGAGIVLVGQMFHLQAYGVSSFIVWGCAGLTLTFLVHSRYLFLFTLLIFTGLQWYNATEFNTFSFISLAIMIIGLGYYWMKRPDALLGWCLALSFAVQSIMLVASHDWPFTWFFVPIWLLYALADWSRERKAVYPFQAVPLVAAFAFNLFIVMFWNKDDSYSFHDNISAQPLWYVLSLLVLLAVSLGGKFKYKRLSSSLDFILAIPFFYLSTGVDASYLLTLFLFSLYLLWRGYAEEWNVKINLGTLLFLCSTMAAYGKLAWDFMDKSVFFILGGIILLGLSWFLNRRKKQFLEEVEEDKHHDE